MAQRAATGGQGRMNRRFLFVAILLAALAFVLVYVKIADTGGSNSSSTVAAGDTPVVVAKVPIKERTTITADMLEVQNLTSTVAAGGFASVADVLGKVTKFPVQANQPVLASAVVSTGRTSVDATLQQVVPTGQRGFSIGASQVSNAGGLILPGDWVDVIWICCDNGPIISKTVLKNIQVVAVAQTIVSSGPVGNPTPIGSGTPTGDSSSNPIAASNSKADPTAGSVTVLLDPSQVQLLYLAESSGKLRLDLRGAGDTDLPATAPTTALDLLPLDELNGLPNELKPEGYKR